MAVLCIQNCTQCLHVMWCSTTLEWYPTASSGGSILYAIIHEVSYLRSAMQGTVPARSITKATTLIFILGVTCGKQAVLCI